MPKKKLSLDKDTLVRLQDRQLEASTGGDNPHSDGGRDPFPGSCCRKTCNKEDHPDNQSPTVD